MVPIVVGDGTMSRREADGLCPNCETAREVEQTRCRVCNIITSNELLANHAARPESHQPQLVRRQ